MLGKDVKIEFMRQLVMINMILMSNFTSDNFFSNMMYENLVSMFTDMYLYAVLHYRQCTLASKTGLYEVVLHRSFILNVRVAIKMKWKLTLYLLP